MESTWKTRHAAQPIELYELDIGPFRCQVWPDGEWVVLVAGHRISAGLIAQGGNRIDDAKLAAIRYVEAHHKRMTADLDFLHGA